MGRMIGPGYWGSSNMNVRLLAAVLAACQILISPSSLLAQDAFGYRIRPEDQPYHACLYAHFIENYCRFHNWGWTDRSFRDCVIAHGACDCGSWGPDVAAACQTLVSVRPR